MSMQASAPKVGDAAVQGGTLVKLAIFAVSLALAPISTYFGSQKYLWSGDSTLAAITAVFAANVVLVAYIVQSVLEDKATQDAKKPVEETKKDR